VEFGSAEVQVFALSGLARLCLAQDDLASAANYYDQVDALLQAHTFSLSIMAYVDYYRFQLFLKQGNLAAAAEWVDSRADQPGPLNPYALHRLALPQIMIIQGNFDVALDNLEVLIQEAQDTGHGSLLVKALVLQALAFRASGNNSQALSTLERALALAETEGFVRVFVDEGEPLKVLLADYRSLLSRQPSITPDDSLRRLLGYTNKLLAEFPLPVAQVPPWPDPLLDPLSKRELEVLQLIAAGASNKEIADALVVALPTAKKHVSNILSKLNASSRTQAVAEARALGLL
jgi:LuxR family maltose regulon positive regulatory protein